MKIKDNAFMKVYQLLLKVPKSFKILYFYINFLLVDISIYILRNKSQFKKQFYISKLIYFHKNCHL